MADASRNWAPEIALIIEASSRMAKRFNCQFVPDPQKIEDFPAEERPIVGFVPPEFLAEWNAHHREDRGD